MNALMKRLSEPGRLWRHVYKALLVIDYMLKNGSTEVAQFCREVCPSSLFSPSFLVHADRFQTPQHIIEIQTLTHFQHVDETDQKDQGINVRERAKVVLELLHDQEKLADERKRARAARSKYVGVSNEDADMLRRQHRGTTTTTSSSSSRYMDHASSEDDHWGMGAGEYDYHHEPPIAQPAAAAEPEPEPEPAPAEPAARQATLLDVPSASAPAVAAPPAASVSLFDALSVQPTAAPAPVVDTSFFGSAAAAPAPAPAPATASFFDPFATSAAAPAPVPAPAPAVPAFDPFFASMPAPAPAMVSPGRPAAPSTTFAPVATAAPTSATAGSAFGSAFGDFEEAPHAAGTASTKTAAAPSSGLRDMWGSVNLDSLGSTAAKKKESPATGTGKRVPMAAMTATGPAMRATTATGPVLTPTPATPAVLTPTPAVPAGRGVPMAGGYGTMGMGGGWGMPAQQQQPRFF